MGLGCEDELYVSRKVFGGGRTIGARRWWKLGAGYGTVGSLRERRGARKDRHGLGGAVEKAGKDGGGGVCGGRDAGGESGRDLTGRRGEGEKGLGRGGDGGCVCMLGVEGVTGIYLCRKQRRTASRVAYFRSFVRSFFSFSKAYWTGAGRWKCSRPGLESYCFADGVHLARILAPATSAVSGVQVERSRVYM